MELQVYRPGAEMIHPVTRQVLGSYEKNLGVLSVTEVRENYSRGTLDAAGAAAGIVAGDRVRLSARRLRTLLHVAGAAAGIEIGPLAQALIARGEQSGRFAMIDEPAWAPSLAALGAPWETVRADPAPAAPSRGSWRRRTCCCSRGSSRAPSPASRSRCGRCAPGRCWAN